MRSLGGGGLMMMGAGLTGAVGGHLAANDRPDSASDSRYEPGSGADGDPSYQPPGRLSSELPVGAAAGPYGTEFDPPDDMAGDAIDHLTFPPPHRATDGPLDIEMSVVEKRLVVSRSHVVDAWTYNGTTPGPTIRATEGDLIRIRFSNRTGHDHNLHFHGRHSPFHDGWEPVPPGGETVYEIVAGPAGVHPYHCHTMPIDRHISKGLYGTLIVDPPGGRSDAHEIVLALSGWDVNDDGINELYGWNGAPGFYGKFPIKVPVGERIRAYVLNMTEYDPIASFHLHAEVFDVYPAGIGDSPAFTSDVLTMGQMDRAIIEFTLPERGRYMFHPHQHSIAFRGATGWFSAI